MGNKGAVGVRFRVSGPEGTAGETYTYVFCIFWDIDLSTSFLSRFVNCHLTPFDHKLNRRIADYNHIVRTLLFAPSSQGSKVPSTLYESSHLFMFGDLNFRLDIPQTDNLFSKRHTEEFSHAIEDEKTREELKEFDQLTIERRKGTVFVGLREGDFWKFKCSYKYKLGEVDKYRYVFFSYSEFLLFLIKFLARNVRPPGRTEFCTQHIPIPPIPQMRPILATCCTRAFLRTPPLTTYVMT